MSMSVGLVGVMTTTIIPQATQKARAAFYFLFAQLFREPPTPELLRQLVEHRWLTASEQWATPERSLDPVEDPVWPAHAEAIAVEYARLFAVPGDPLAALE